MPDLDALARFLSTHPAVREKARIHDTYARALPSAGKVALGDDAAAIQQPDGSHLLFAAEGMLESFIRDDPWFAGYSAVMVNLSDIAAMGGRPVAITDVLGSPSDDLTDAIWAGMQAASLAYGVPIVGGHTTHTRETVSLAASVIGKAGNKLLTSFDARPGDCLAFAIDLNGAYRGDKPFWNASTSAPPDHLRSTLDLLPLLAESDLCRAAKDVSNGGIAGTLAMFCHCSGVGAVLDLDTLPLPAGTPLERWLVSFPSYGYLLAVAPEKLDAVQRHFTPHGIACAAIGRFTSQPVIVLASGGSQSPLDFR